MSVRSQSILLCLMVCMSACAENAPTGAIATATATGPKAEYLSYSNFAKPVNGLREYNGTYMGSPSTGSIGYSTLYRDNYHFSGKTWEGEGAGKHTGVDIPVSSWTSVYAVQGGQIVYRACGTDGFGGRITIQSPHPYLAGRSVYHTYAHLNDWDDRALYSSVSTGELIGRSGGGNTDVCPGFSTSAHLHYQIDNDNDAAYPHGRSFADTNVPDAQFVVNAHTYNPMVFLQGGYRWEFQGNNDDEYWRAINITAGGISDGAFWIDGNADPYLWRSGQNVSCGRTYLCSTQIAAEANLYRYVRLDTWMGGCWNPPMKIYFKTSAENWWDEAKSVEGDFFFGPVFGYQPTFNMANNPRWTGIITGLRLDPAGDCSGTDGRIYIGYIRLTNT